eukprot:3746159-Pleurochrysis_carterae.AAC.4
MEVSMKRNIKLVLADDGMPQQSTESLQSTLVIPVESETDCFLSQRGPPLCLPQPPGKKHPSELDESKEKIDGERNRSSETH